MLHPTAIAYDAAGNLYVADANRQQVFEATLAGALVVIAGTGTQGFTGDGEQATAAQLNSPQGIAVAADGTLYIADTGNHRIRAVAGGLITTVAAVESPTALAVDSTGALLVCDSTRHRVLRIAGGAASTVAGSGTQGFAGDGGPAASAQIDTPSGLAVAVDGRIFIADTHNDRVRVIATDGTIATFAGTGLRGYSGDGGAAVRAQLSLPHGLAMTPMGALLVADSNNQRLRFVDATGIIHTLVGSGEQGIANDGSTVASVELNLPRSAAVDSFGSPVMVDAGDAAVRIAWNDGRLYAPAAFATGRTTAVTLSVPAAVSYGSSAAQFAVSGQAGAAVGLVQLLDAGTQVAKAALAQGAATFSLGQLGAGTHTLQGMYLGDGVNPSASSSVTGVTITPAVVTASADPQSILYGQQTPTLTGTSSGVLPQDAATVGVSFTTPAADMSPPGAYPITAALSGSAARNYSLVMAANSGLLRITQAPTTTVARPPSQSSYAGLPLQVVASVSPAYRGTPGGVVTFLEGGNVVATAALSGGVATGVYLAPTAGTHTLTASYPGDANFHASDSAVVTAVVGALPDFTVAATGTSSQTVQSGSVATYGFAVAGQQGAFSGAVSFSVAGLPAGATAAFSPQQTVPGAGSSAVVMTVQTPAQHGRNGAGDSKGRLAWLAMMLPLPLPLMLVGRRRRWRLGAARTCCLLWFALGITGCSERVLVESAAASQTYTLTVTGTGTNLAGAVVAHSCVFGLTIN